MLKSILKKCSILVILVKKNRVFKINRLLKNDKIIHLMFNDKFIKPYVDFLNDFFDSKKNIVLCKRWFSDYPFPTGSNVFEINSYEYIKLNISKKIICHSLFDNEIIDIFYRNKKLLNKASWIIWGGDLYDAKRDEKNDYVRSHFSEYIGLCDKEIIISKYNKNANVIGSGGYLFPITKKMLDSVISKEKRSDAIKIQINNSSDESTIDILYKLEKFKNENIIIRTILSYGDLKVKEEIINVGLKIFRNKFEYLDTYLSPENYAKYIAENNILILNQKRQQGVGNTKAFLYLKKKVFIRSDVTTYKYLRDMGIEIYDTKEILNLSYNDFIKNDFECQNKKIIERHFDLEYLAKTWKNILE